MPTSMGQSGSGWRQTGSLHSPSLVWGPRQQSSWPATLGWGGASGGWPQERSHRLFPSSSWPGPTWQAVHWQHTAGSWATGPTGTPTMMPAPMMTASPLAGAWPAHPSSPAWPQTPPARSALPVPPSGPPPSGFPSAQPGSPSSMTPPRPGEGTRWVTRWHPVRYPLR